MSHKKFPVNLYQREGVFYGSFYVTNGKTLPFY
jgi:hypothetical protein